MKTIVYILSIFVLIAQVSCTTTKKNTEIASFSPEVQKEAEKLDEYFERSFNFWVDRNPETQTYLGLKTNYDKLADYSEDRSLEDLGYTIEFLRELRQFNYDILPPSHKVSYKLYEQSMLREIEDFRYRFHSYPVNQMFGVQSSLPSFMINIHTVDNKRQLEDYISRLSQFGKRFDYVIDGLQKRAKLGIIAPKFVYPKAIDDARNVISGHPFDNSGKDSPLLADFKKKMAKLNLSKSESEKLEKEAKSVLLTKVQPSYKKLIAYLVELQQLADNRAGAWKLPEGREYYTNRLKRITTTEMTADEIHRLGLKEVKRIHEEMNKIKRKVGFKGSLKQFFKFMQNDKQFYYPDSEKGRQQYLSDTKDIINGMKAQLDNLFNIKPESELIVKPVEAYREKSAGLAFYQGPPMIGDRPGIYYVNLYDMKAVSKYEMEALAYHEAIPGHHMQISIAKKLENVPKFRRFGGYTAYSEGWGLYAEYIPKELGFYKDPYSDFGRLSMELWRACRLVVDTGIHEMKWTREQAIAYLDKNTPSLHADNVKAAERYIVMPGQATAYKVGILKILELRKLAENELGQSFDVRKFHDVILANGAMPLNLLEEQVKDWVRTAKGVEIRQPAAN